MDTKIIGQTKESGLEGDAKETKYMLVSYHQSNA
jgi:hypothetical protein